MKLSRFFSCCAAAIMLAAVPALGATEFRGAAPGNSVLIDVRTPNYAYTVRVSVVGWNRPDVLVDQTSSNAGEVRASIAREGSVTKITPSGGILRSSSFFGLIHSSAEGTVNWTVRVPNRSAVQVIASNSPIDVDGVVGALSLQTSNGRITVQGAGSSVDAKTSNGRVEISIANLDGRPPAIDARTANGEINLRVPHGFHTKVAARTVNGSVTNPFENGTGPGSASLSTMNGSITVIE